MLQQGVLFETAEGPLIFRGSITVCCADNLGSHALESFKELLLIFQSACQNNGKLFKSMSFFGNETPMPSAYVLTSGSIVRERVEV